MCIRRQPADRQPVPGRDHLGHRPAEIVEDCITNQGIKLNVRAVAAFKVGDDPVSISNAAASLADGNQELIAANRVVEALPSLVASASQGIAGSNLTILNGSEGVSHVVAGLVAQGLSILDTLRSSTAAVANGSSPVPAARTG